MVWLLNILISIKVGLCSCTPEVRRLGTSREHLPHQQPLRLRPQFRVERVGRLPKAINESSGLARRTATSVWTHNDGGGRPTIYGVSLTNPGTLVDSLPLPQLGNIDWEDLAQQDSSQHGDAQHGDARHEDAQQGTARLFVADLGNNGNARRDLAIHIVDPAQNRPPETIRVRYADQTAYPPKGRNFDCEAVFYRRDSLFLLSKNRSGHMVRLYGLPATAKARADDYALMPLDSVYIKSMVTGAALSPGGDGKAGQTLAVLTYGKVLFFDLSAGAATRLSRFAGCLRLPRGQTEAITFLTDNELLISNERGWLYRVVRR